MKMLRMAELTLKEAYTIDVPTEAGKEYEW